LTRAFVFLTLILLPLRARAQAQTGSISGEIADQDGLPLADVRVVVRSPTQIGGDRVIATDRNGRFIFLNLAPGIFELRASRTGLGPISKSGIRVQAGRAVELFEIMQIPTAAEEIVVTAPPPAVDTTSSEVGETLDDELLESVPLPGRGFQAAAAAAPGVSGGSNPNVRGGAFFNNTYTVDGITITDPVTHTFGTNFNFDAIAGVEVLTAGYGPEFSLTTGGVINVVTESGSNQLHTDLSVYYLDDALSVERPEERGQEFRNLSANANLSGPIVRDRIWFFGSLQFDDNISSIPNHPTGLLPSHPARRFFGVQYLGKLNIQVADPTQVILQVQGAPASIDNTRQSLTVLPEAERHQDQRTLYLSGEVRQSLGANMLWRSQIVWGEIVLDVYPQSEDFETPGYVPDAATGVESVNDTLLVHDVRHLFAINSDVTHALGRGLGTHALRYGLKYNQASNPSYDRVTGDATYQAIDGEPFARTVHCLEFDPVTGYCRRGGLETTTQGRQLLVFAQDGWSPRFYDAVTLTPGVGIQHGQTSNFEGATVTEFTTATPHINFTWRPLQGNRTVVRGGYNQYVDVGFLALAGFAGRSLETQRCRYDADSVLPEEERYTLDCFSGGGEEGVTVGHPRGPEGEDLTNPDPLRTPRVHELHVGAEREVVSSLAVGGDVVYREYTHQWEDIETNLVWNDDGTDFTDFRNGEARTVFDLETPDSARRSHFSWTVFGRRSGPKWNLLASYTWARSEGTVNEGFATLYLDNPTQSKFFDGPLSDDRTHTVKTFGSYQVIEPLTLGSSISLLSGQPYSRLYFNPAFGGFSDRRAPRGQDPHDPTDPGDDTELRYPWQLQVDVKAVYSFEPMIHQDIEAIVEIFNLFDLEAATAIEQRELAPSAPTQFGDVLARQAPLRARIGLRYRY